MSARTANVTSLDAMRALHAALVQFAAQVQDALVALDLEGRRPLDWIENDRSRYWPQQVRIASDAVSEARIALERCELTTSGDERRYCYDERKALQRAQRRLRLAEEKVQAVRRWKFEVRKATEEFQVQIARLKGYLDGDFVKALAALERMATALDRYAQSSGPVAAAGAVAAQAAIADRPEGTA